MYSNESPPLAKKCNVPRSIIYRSKKGTTFRFYENLYKIIRYYKFDYVSEIFSISENRLKTSIEERSLTSKYPNDTVGRYAYNIFCLQIIADIFIKKIKPDEISNQFMKILSR